MSQPEVTAHPGIPPWQRLYWSLRRELWESRSIYLAPVAVVAVYLFGFSISTLHLAQKLGAATVSQRREIVEAPYEIASLALMAATFFVSLFYSLEALHAERRDRGILFWKSLPVSDLTTVLAKTCIPLLVLPLITFVVTAVTHTIMMLIAAAALTGSGMSAAAHVALFPMWATLLFHLVAIHGLWYAPIYGWLLLVSAWARRAPFLWAILPLIAIGVVEKVAFNTAHFAALLENRVIGSTEGAMSTVSLTPMDAMTHVDPVQFLLRPGLWIGLAFTAACLAAAVRLRRSNGPI